MILQLMRLSAPATRIEFLRWKDQRLKILDEEIMFLFCGPSLENPRTFFESPLSYCFEVIWSCTFDRTKFMPCQIPLSQNHSHNTRVPFLWRFTAAQYKLRIVELFKVFKKICLWGTACSIWQESLWSPDHERKVGPRFSFFVRLQV
jgi:hypothetical protein